MSRARAHTKGAGERNSRDDATEETLPAESFVRRVTRKKDDQSVRFIEAAKAAGADETGKEFERAFRKIVKPKRAPKKK